MRRPALPSDRATVPTSRRAARRALAALVLGASCSPAPTPVPVTPAAPVPGAAPVTAAQAPAAPAAPAAAAATPGGTAPAWRPAPARMLTRWAADVRPDAVLPEYPRPQLVRPRWQSLNGLWEFASGPTRTPTPGRDPYRLAHPSRSDGTPPAGAAPGDFDRRILVPFAPEAALSGVGAHAERVAYRRTFTRPADLAVGERLLLHVGACDWECAVVVNGRELTRHRGGYEAFTVDVTDALVPAAAQQLVVSVWDPTDEFGQPRGKQVSAAEGIWYTPVTGLWQTVWLEPVPASSVASLRMTPDPSPDPSPGSRQAGASVLRLTVTGRGTTAGQRVVAVASSAGREVGRAEGAVGAPLRVPVPNAHLWSPDDPFLYDLRVTLVDGGREIDRVDSYFGMRTSGLVTDAQGKARLALNGRAEFQLGPLDQGWWPDGLYTAPTDAALRADVEMIKALGFNMVRKHIKVEPARWYYYADKLGLAVWQDMPSGWNDSPAARQAFERELRGMLAQLHNVPSIVTWVPFNEKWGQFDTERIVGIVRRLDSSRTINDVSGWQHGQVGDIIDVHRYQGPQAMWGTAARASVVGEFGGLGYKEPGHAWAGDAWGYGGLFPSRDSLAARYELLTKRMWDLRDSHAMSAGVYTQLTDVEVELNGFLTYDRAVAKFDTARTAAVNRGYAPYIQPELGEFTNAVRVRITQGTPTEVRYTTDGSAPTATSPRYRAPFTVRATTTVRARAFGAGAAAPEARVDYVKGPGRAPVRIAAERLAPGLAYAFYADTTTEPAYRMNWPVRWQLERPDVQAKDIAPRKTGVARDVALGVADTTELFGLRFTGYLRVPRAGVYTFTARSDDGAALWVGDRNVFWSVGQSPTTTETPGQIALGGGLHPITLTYFQAYGPRALELWVEGPGVAPQRVPASWYVHDRPHR